MRTSSATDTRLHFSQIFGWIFLPCFSNHLFFLAQVSFGPQPSNFTVYINKGKSFQPPLAYPESAVQEFHTKPPRQWQTQSFPVHLLQPVAALEISQPLTFSLHLQATPIPKYKYRYLEFPNNTAYPGIFPAQTIGEQVPFLLL